ncbi:MAG: NB-ARC domain-containing protein [Chloroflexota bacterium]
MDLQAFGQQLRTLRKQSGLSQGHLADKLEMLALAASPEAYRAVDASLVSKWERAKQRQNRPWKPTRQYTFYLIQIFADQLDLESAMSWAAQADYQFASTLLQDIFTDQLSSPLQGLRPMQHPPVLDNYVIRSELETVIQTSLQSQQTVVLYGVGGSGKSTLATSIANQVADSFADGVIWVDDCQTPDGTYQVTVAQDRISNAFQVELKGQTVSERAGQLRSLLWGKHCLLVLDDVWDSTELAHLRVYHEPSRLLVTTRNEALAYEFGTASPINVTGLTLDECNRLLGQEEDALAEASDWEALLQWVGYLPLGVDLLRVLLQSGYTTSALLRHFEEAPTDTTIGLSRRHLRALNTCFDLNYHSLSEDEQRYFAQLSCFHGRIAPQALPQIWGVKRHKIAGILDQLDQYALVSRDVDRYRLHPLLRYYARQKLSTDWSDWITPTYQQYTRFLIKHYLYHPQLLPNTTAAAPKLDSYWTDIITCLNWAIDQEPQLLPWALLLAHTERPALFESLGDQLTKTIQRQLSLQRSLGGQPSTLSPLPLSEPEGLPLFYEQLATLYLRQQEFDIALNCFDIVISLWDEMKNYLACSRMCLRQAGTHLLKQNPAKAAALAQKAQTYLEQALPLKGTDILAARQLFYWFNMVYLALVRWSDLPQDDVARLAELAEQTGDDHLAARGLHVYRVWCTVPTLERSADIRALGQALSAQVVARWQQGGELDHAASETMWATYALTGEISDEASESYARRISETTPTVTIHQLQVIDSPGIQWWLQTDPNTRIQYFAKMIPRYFKATNSTEPWFEPNSDEWSRVRDIIGIRGAFGRDSRRVVMIDDRPPEGHFLNAPEWNVFSGQKILPLIDAGSERFVNKLLMAL